MNNEELGKAGFTSQVGGIIDLCVIRFKGGSIQQCS